MHERLNCERNTMILLEGKVGKYDFKARNKIWGRVY